MQWIFETGSKRYETVLGEAILRGYASCLTAVNAEAALEEIKRFRILCAVNRGPFGVMDVNAFAERRLRSKGLIDSGAARLASGYRGLPILITQNLYTLNLFNGDTGLLWFAPGKGLVAVFPGLQGPSKTLAVSRLPHFETAYAMTVHKSQGSEFDEVLLILPERDLPILTRELLYTGITRARRRLVLWASEEVIRQAVSRRIERSSGLRDALWGRGNA